MFILQMQIDAYSTDRPDSWTQASPGAMTVGFGPHYNTVGVLVMPVCLFIVFVMWIWMGSPEARREREEAEKAQAGVKRSREKALSRQGSKRGGGWLSKHLSSTPRASSPRMSKTNKTNPSMLSASPPAVMPKSEAEQPGLRGERHDRVNY